MTELCEHKWEPLERWWGRYRCWLCRALGYRGTVIDADLTRKNQIKPYKCSKSGCKEPGRHARKGLTRQAKVFCDSHLEEYDKKMKDKYGLVRDDDTW